MDKNIMEIKQRQEKLCLIMKEQNLDYVIISATPHIDHKGLLRYFTGQYLLFFEETLLLRADGYGVYFAHDPSAKATVLQLETVNEVQLIPSDEYNLKSGKIVAEYLLKQGLKKSKNRVGIGPKEAMSASFYLSVIEHLGESEVLDLSSNISNMMMVKSENELNDIRNAVRKNEECLNVFAEHMAVGTTELEAVRYSNQYAEKAGAERTNWLIASGEENLALYTLPEAKRRNHIWKKEDYVSVVLEHSFDGGYHGEASQVFCFKEPPEEVMEAYKILDNVFAVIESEIKAGITVKMLMDNVDMYLSATTNKHIYMKNSTAALGHGQGLATWEFPRMAWDSEMILEENMHLAVHPAIPTEYGITASYCKHYIVKKQNVEIVSSLQGYVRCIDNKMN